MSIKNNFAKISESQATPKKIETGTISIFFSEMKPKRNDRKTKYSIIRKNLLSFIKEDFKNSKELSIKSYKEDLDLEKLNRTHYLFIINNENYNDNTLGFEKKLDLEFSKIKYARNNRSSSDMSD